MQIRKKYILWLLFSSMIISIGAGHGVAPIIMIQFSGPGSLWYWPAALFSLGQISLISTLFIKSLKWKPILFIMAVIFILTGIGSLISIGLEDYNSAIPVYVTAIPFGIILIRTILKSFRK